MDIDFGEVDEFFMKKIAKKLFSNNNYKLHLLQTISQLRKVSYHSITIFQPRPMIFDYHCKGLGAIALMYMQIQRFFMHKSK